MFVSSVHACWNQRNSPGVSVYEMIVFTYVLRNRPREISAMNRTRSTIRRNLCACYLRGKSLNPDAPPGWNTCDRTQHCARRIRAALPGHTRYHRCRRGQARSVRDTAVAGIRRVTIRFKEATRSVAAVSRVLHRGTFGPGRRRNASRHPHVDRPPPDRQSPATRKIRVDGEDLLGPWVVYCGGDYGAFERSEL